MDNIMVICPSGPHGHVQGHNKHSWNHVGAVTQQPLGWFTPNQVHWNCLGLRMCNVMVICLFGPYGHTHGHSKGTWNLAGAETQQPPGIFTPNQVYSHHFACGCAVSWWFYHLGHMSVPTRVMRALGTLLMPELTNHCAHSLQIKFIGIVLACARAVSWSFAHHSCMGMSMGLISPLGTLFTGRGTLQCVFMSMYVFVFMYVFSCTHAYWCTYMITGKVNFNEHFITCFCVSSL